ncbi:uL30 family ribosomal protein [Candidatus Nitrosocosmicus franklandus]|uniref:50S ribosomal protein L30 n=1 Tax=Candidatus Nitrosocosmicus franklandianus TaxID=1798806 RepID=A0A484IJM1_9ARCH|nr:uL30 family ribosomal protein [Candidatus Nitrosocosmicus franklandus]VFJ15079.1 50S ribosomal protein L30 [Candidatus Nitrosocosmicus franklandus]
MVYLVVRMKGTVNIPNWARITLDNLHLNKKFRATLIPENEQTLGMLRKIKEIVAWTSVEEGFIRDFIEKKGRYSSAKLLSSINKSETTSPAVPNIDQVVSDISKNNTFLSKISGIKPWFALNPPRGGFKKKSKLLSSQNGILGENHELVELVKRMM